MLSTTQIAIDLSTTAAAAGIGIIRFKKLDRFCSILLLQVIIYLPVDYYATFVKGNNSWLYNLYIPIETLLLFLAAGVCFNNSKSRMILSVLFGFFLLIFMLDIFILTGFTSFATHASVAEGFLLTAIYMTILYRSFQKKHHAAIILASVGMVLYFAGSLPFLSMLYYLQESDPLLNQKLFGAIIVVLAGLRYFFIAIALLLANRTKIISN